MLYKFSKYNNNIVVNNSCYIHNGLSGALVSIDDPDLISAVEEQKEFEPDQFDDKIFESLKNGMYIVRHDLDEVEFLKARYNAARFNDNPHITFLPTLNCNMRCSYCYESKSTVAMDKSVIDRTKLFLLEWLNRHHQKKLQVDWYGGEPLLEICTILDISDRIIEIAQKNELNYTGKLITNGVLLTPHNVDELIKRGITRCQVTIDGTEKVHDHRRKLKNGESSYKTILNNLCYAAQYIQVSIRINIDKSNSSAIIQTLDDFNNYKLFSAKKPVVPYIAPTAPYSENCSHINDVWFSPNEFFDVSVEFLHSLDKFMSYKGNSRYLYPGNRNYCCGGVSINSIIINPEGKLFKCAIDVSNGSESVGSIFDSNHIFERLTPKMISWLNYDPFEIDECRQCNYLPLCLGGCPHTQRNPNLSIIKYNCNFFKENFTKSVCLHIEKKAQTDIIHNQLTSMEVL
jgi:uncharacterized protein